MISAFKFYSKTIIEINMASTQECEREYATKLVAQMLWENFIVPGENVKTNS